MFEIVQNKHGLHHQSGKQIPRNITDVTKIFGEDRRAVKATLDLNVPAIRKILKDHLHVTKLFFP